MKTLFLILLAATLSTVFCFSGMAAADKSLVLYFPFDEKRNIFLQQDGFLDKDIRNVDTLPEKERPIHQHWS